MSVEEQLESRVVETCAECDVVNVEVGDVGGEPVGVVVHRPVPVDRVIDGHPSEVFRELEDRLEASTEYEKAEVIVAFDI